MSEEQNQPKTDQKEQNANTPQNTERPKPAGARPAGARPAGARPAGARPAGARPAGARPAGARPAGARPAGAKPADASSTTPAAAAQVHEKPKFQLSKFQPVYIKTWSGKQDTCDICRNLLSEPCNTCETSEANDPCPVVEGICGHMFHLHCIDKWAKKQHTCPNCQQEWQIKSQFQIQ